MQASSEALILQMAERAPGAIPQSDEQLAQRARAGGTQAYSELVSRYQRGVTNYAYRLIGDWQAALDLAQDGFVRAFRSLRTYDPSRPFSPWLFATITHICYA